MDKNKRCLIPWNAIYIRPDGGLSPCCVFQGSSDDINSNDLINSKLLKTLREQMSRGIEPPGCKMCFEQEMQGLESKRKQINHHYKKIGIVTNKTKECLQHADISFNNVCNLKCRFCRSAYSTKWIADEKILSENYPERWGKEHIAKFSDNKNLIEAFLQSNLSELQLLEIRGGEPFLYKDHSTFLKRVIARCDASKVTLLYVTNGTAFDDKLIELWVQFKKINIIVSIDGTSSAYKYIRGGKYVLENEILSFIEKINALGWSPFKLHLGINFTFCALNIFEPQKLLDWLHSLKLKISWKLYFTILEYPKELHYLNIPIQLRLNAAKSLHGPEVQDLKRLLSKKINFDEFSARDFIKHTKIVDHMRGESLAQSIPELSSLSEHRYNFEKSNGP